MENFIKRLKRYKKFTLSKRKKQDIDYCIQMAEHINLIYNWLILFQITPERLEELKKELRTHENI